ncbi:multidrug ABC transporter ATP-binding protein [Exiguobacterium indicum]|uniref:Multidrug ABC transporter ATP-binding protein n=1 Tax=Exiguobacterium indicum TaxID=296995 RepID=A0A0V8GL53_9BACL|nr:ABC-F family ATP-binding cassette domain-containing protein [Exiguobacterium enclense]KSU50996.1 multidrug ABC transporter ATP-binding protein [Exiguobacterium enclense]SDB84674.1 ATP-binding cassette, subfamily F, member 3 [Exiguobacterium enclense]
MILLQVNQLSKSFGVEPILENIKLEVQERDRIALVGRNGAGKSTLLKIIAGELSHDSGDIMKGKDVKIGYLAQDSGLESNETIWNEMLTVFEHLQEQERTLRRMEIEMGMEHILNDPVAYDRLLKTYDQAQHDFSEAGGYQFEANIRSVLHGMRFYPDDYSRRIQTLSGGQRTRLALAKMLLQAPELLILDEPTNHLDIDTLAWLESYLGGYRGAVLIVSHDRYFLDQVVNVVYELSRNVCRKFTGNYTKYLEQKAALYDQEMKQFEQQQEEIAKMQDFIQRNIARATTTKRAQSVRKRLEKVDRLDRPDGDERSTVLSFPIEKQSGNDVLQVNQLAIGYEEAVSKDITFRLQRGESLALVGPNGIGKSTLLKVLVGRLRPLFGDFRFGTGVSIGYYDQEQAELNDRNRVIDEIWNEWPLMREQEVRSVLGQFLFSGDDVFKIVHELSGGERGRLALAKLKLRKTNVLVLDEPTNHLDLDSKMVLENALVDYEGTLLFVSHDRYFIDRIATRVIEMSETGVTEYLGDYSYYTEKKAEQEEIARLEAEEAKAAKVMASKTIDKEAQKEERKRRQQIEQLEQDIERLEQRSAEIEQLLCEPEVFNDIPKATALSAERDQIDVDLLELMERWENQH